MEPEDFFYDEADYYGDFQDPKEEEFKYCECGKLLKDCPDAYEHMSRGY